MKLKKFLDIVRESKGSEIPFKKIEEYLEKKYGDSLSRIGMTAPEMQQVCIDLDIESIDEFMDVFPFPSEKVKGYVSEILLNPGWNLEPDDEMYYGEDEEVYYGKDEENYWDDDKEDFKYDDDFLGDTATMVHNIIEKSGIKNFYVSNSKDNISVQFVLNMSEKFSSMMNIMSMVKKIQTEVLIQYNSEMDLWETKKGLPLLTFDFYYEPNIEGKFKKDDVPF